MNAIAHTLRGGRGPDVLEGGAGLDEVTYWRRRLPIRADFDGVADDGARGERDRIASDVEWVTGGARCGGPTSSYTRVATPARRHRVSETNCS
jgi:hypothetical protein